MAVRTFYFHRTNLVSSLKNTIKGQLQKGPMNGSQQDSLAPFWRNHRYMQVRSIPYPSTVNSRYCGHFWDCVLVSVLARVSNGGVREKILENEFMGRGLLVFTFMLTAVPTRARTRNIVIYFNVQTEQYSTKQNLQMPLCSTKESTLSILMVFHNKVLH